MVGLLYVTALMITFALTALMAASCWEKPSVQGSRWLAALNGAIGFWALTQAAQALAVFPKEKFFYHALMYIGITLTPVFLLCFVLDYYSLLKPLPGLIKGTLFVIPALTVGIIASNDAHRLFYRSWELTDLPPYAIIDGTFNMWFWVHSAYSYLLVVGAILVLLFQTARQSRIYQRQSLQIVAAILATSGLNVLYITRVFESMVDMTPFTFLLASAAFHVSLFNVQVAELGPITKDLLYENTRDGILILDAAGTVIEYNTAFSTLLGLGAKNLIGIEIGPLMLSLGYDPDHTRNTVAATGKILTGEGEQARSLRISTQEVTGKDGAQEGTIYFFKDMTRVEADLAAADEALMQARHARESITRYLSDMSHEIRTPLTGILGGAQHLRSNAGSDVQAHCSDQILAGASQLLGTINRILDFSKLDSGNMQTHETAFRPEAFRRFLEGQEPLAATVAFPPVLPEVNWVADYHRLTQLWQLLTEFLTEAGCHEAGFELQWEDGTLTVSCRYQTDSAPAVQLLEAWETLEDHLLTPHTPDPMRPVLAKRLAVLLKGQLAVLPEPPGWNLRLILPVRSEAVRSPDGPMVPVKPTDHCYRILFVDDSRINQAVFGRMLRESGWQIHFASTGEEGLQKTREQDFDIIFTDINMPGMSGIDLSRQVSSEVPVIALTADADEDLRARVQNSPIRQMLTKPCPKELLIQTVLENALVREGSSGVPIR